MNTRKIFRSRAKDFWGSDLGRRVLDAQFATVATHVRRLHGNTALWVGETQEPACLLQQCMVRDALYLNTGAQLELNLDTAPTFSPVLEMPYLKGQLEGLPFAKHQFDGLVLHHALELSADPRAGLREAARVLAPGGRIVIVGFNPFSLFGLRRGYAKWVPDFFSDRQFVNPLRLFDWLELLGFALDARPTYMDYRLPLVPPQSFDRAVAWLADQNVVWPSMRWFKRAPLGAVVIVSAVKRALPLSLTRTTNNSRSRLAPIGYSKVTDLRLSTKERN